MADFWRQQDAGKERFDTDNPLDTVPQGDPKKFGFELPFHDPWGWYPFIYESERTFRLGGLTFVDFFAFQGSGFSLPPLALQFISPSLESAGGNDPEPSEAAASEEAGGIASNLCVTATDDLIAVEPETEVNRVPLCQSVLQPCSFANLYMEIIAAMSNAGTLADTDGIDALAGTTFTQKGFAQSPGLSNFTSCGSKATYEFNVTATVTASDPTFSTFRVRVEALRDGGIICASQNIGVSCLAAGGQPNSCSAVVESELARNWKIVAACFKANFEQEANSGCSNCEIDTTSFP